jgi:hypothetical protein
LLFLAFPLLEYWKERRQMATGKKINFRIPKKTPQPEESSSDVSKAAPKLSIKEKLERAKKLAASLGSSKSTLGTSKDKEIDLLSCSHLSSFFPIFFLSLYS